MGDGIQGPQDIEALPTRRGLDEHARQRPQKAEKRREHEMGGVHKENGSLSSLGFG